MKIILLAIIIMMIVPSIMFAPPLNPEGFVYKEAADGSWAYWASWHWVGNTLHYLLLKTCCCYQGHWLIDEDSWVVENPCQ